MSDQELSSSPKKTFIKKGTSDEVKAAEATEQKRDEISINENNKEASDEDEAMNAEKIYKRQNMAVLIASEKELRNFEQVKIKCSQFTGVCLKIKNLTDKHMETLLTAIEKDAEDYVKQLEFSRKLAVKEEAIPQQIGTNNASASVTYSATTSGIVNLRFEECNFSSRSLAYFRDWMSKKALLETLDIQRIAFQDPIPDFKKIMESIQYNTKIRKVTFSFMQFDEESHGKQISKMLNDSKSMRELDINFCEFIHPKCFFDMCSALLQERCRLNILRLRNIQITNLESKVIQYILMKNKQLNTIDFSNCRIDSPENLEFFLQKLGKDSYIRYLTLSGLQGDMSTPIEVLGEALGESFRMEIIILNENKIRHTSYIKFWEFLMGNKSIKKISVMKTEVSDKTCESIGPYLSNKWCTLIDLDLSRNLITDVGLTTLMTNLISHSSLLYLNLTSNQIRDKGLVKLVEYLVKPKCTLLELSLQSNKINNEGMETLAGFLAKNKSLKMLDLAKNEFSDHGFEPFAAEIAKNTCLTLLDISRNKEINDEGSLVTLVQSIAFNKSIQTLDLNGIRIRKPFLKSHFEPALISNITLKFVNGKMQAEIVNQMLDTNIVIETKVLPNYLPKAKFRKGDFNVKIVDSLNTSFLNMSGCDNSLFQPALKFVKYHDIRTCDFSNMRLQDISMQLIADYLQKNPNMRSLILDGNDISDYGMQRLAISLKKNKKLAHISIKNCAQITEEGLKLLLEVISTDNSVLFSIQFDEHKFNYHLSKAVILESTLNRAIQEHLKPIIVRNTLTEGQQPLNSDRSEGRLKDQPVNTRFMTERKELVFDEHASITSYFESAVKCWRINEPTVIIIEDQGLTDENCVALCNFLKDKNMINELNLRRNKITNKGAIAIADLIVNHDKEITKLDITRNKITDEGAQIILVALKKVVRIRELSIQYGNHLAPQTAIDLYLEVKANENIQKNYTDTHMFHSSKIRISKIRYELTDKGPDYIRCAIKSVELLNILHMSLPDNMISRTETRMLAHMIQQNPPLVTLNVSNNNLDADCAILLAESLKFNDRLKILNLDKNKLGDKGIMELLKPLIKQKFELFVVQKTAVIVDNSTIPDDKEQVEQKEEDEHKETGESKKEEKQQAHVQSGLKTINLVKNLASLESYKQIWLLMKVNANILLTYDSVEQIKERLQAKSQGKDDTLDTTTELNHTNAALLSDRSGKQSSSAPFSPKSQQVSQPLSPKSQNDEGSVEGKENSVEDEYDDEADLEAQRLKLEMEQKMAAEEALKQSKIDQEKRIRNLVVKLSCYQTDEEDEEVTQLPLKQICCWRIYASRNRAREFWLNDQDPQQEIESKSKENCISTLILFNEALLYGSLIVPFVFPKIYTAGFIMIGVTSFFIIVEIIAICLYRQQVDLPKTNCYLFMMTNSGYASRIMLLALAYFGGLYLFKGKQKEVTETHSASDDIGAFFSIIFLILGQIMPISRIFKGMTVDKNAIRPLRERTRLLAGATYFKGLEAVLIKSSLEPSQDSQDQAKEIYQTLLYLENVFDPLHQRIFNLMKSSYNLNHLVLTDIPVICLICAEAIEGVDSLPVTLILVAIWIIDVLLVVIQLVNKEAKVSMETESVQLLQLERQEEFGEKYAELQNIEDISRDVEIIDSDGDVDEQDGSQGKLKISQKTENFTEGIANLSERKKSLTNVRSPPELKIETRKIKTAWQEDTSNLDAPIKHSDLNPKFNSGDHATIEP